MNNYSNINKMIKISEPSWKVAEQEGMAGLAVEYINTPFLRSEGNEFINMCSCSYLGLDTHPDILQGASQGVLKAGALHLTTARTRLKITMLSELEERLSAHYQGYAASYVTCSAATSAFLPIYASGTFTQDVKPVMVFDKFAHFSMNHIKPICADETEVLTSPHNDLNFIEDICRKNKKVAYIADGTYSVDGFAPIDELIFLQEKYGLFLYLDDSHGLSVTGDKGEGYILNKIGSINENTVVVGSLAKAFGACGGLLLSGRKEMVERVVRYGNPWSQYLNSAGIGGCMAALDIHQSPELAIRQKRWRENLNIIDKSFSVINSGKESPVRVVLLKSAEAAVKAAKLLLNEGYYTSSVFFPIVPRDKAGLRIMPSANVSAVQMHDFCQKVKQICAGDLLSNGENPLSTTSSVSTY